ncbi:MAG: hypothetical protein ACI3Z0_03565 [Candidatus Cryptobacteroides sp.]
MYFLLKAAVRFSAALILLAGIVSCGKDTIVLGNCYTMGTVLSEDSFRTDENLIFNIVDGNNCSGIVYGTRIFVNCDVLSALPGNADEYEVRVTALEVATVADALNIEPDLSIWNDAIEITDAWISGGYLNMYCVWIHKRNSAAEHRTGLCLETSEEVGDTLSFKVCHDGQGEGFYNDTKDVSELEVVSKIVTFPIEEFLPDGNVTVKLTYKWHKSDGQMIYPETEEHSIKCSYNYSPAFSLASPAPASPSTKAMISPLATLLP